MRTRRALIGLLTLSLGLLVLAPVAAARKPDLVETQVSKPPANRAQGGDFNVKDTVKNKGDSKAGKSVTTYFLSTDQAKSKSDKKLTGQRNVPALSPGSSSQGTKKVTIPLNTIVRKYFVLACADGKKDVNESNEGNNCKSSSSKLNVTPKDTTPPAAPIITGTAPPSPFSATSISVKGSAEPGGTVALFKTNDCTNGAATTGSSQTFSDPGLNTTVAENATTTFTVNVTDEANNTSECSAPITYTHDGIAPATPTITGSNPTSPSPNNLPKIIGTAEAGSTVTLYKTNDCQSGVASGSAATFASPGIVGFVDPNTTNSFTVKAADAAGNTSPCSAPFTYVEDSTAPPAPTITATDPTSPSTDATPMVIGTAEAGSTVHIYKSANCLAINPSDILATGSAANFANPGLLVNATTNSTTTLTAAAFDAANNMSQCSNSFNYVHDSALEVEPNDTAAQAQALPGNPALAHGKIDPIGDPDYFSFSVPAGGSVIAETFDGNPALNSCAEGGSRDTVVTLFAPDGSTQLASDDDDGISECSKLDGTDSDTAAEGLAEGIYFIRVTDFLDNSVISDYRLRITIVRPQDEVEPNNSFAQATTMLRRFASGAISPLGDKDYFAIQLPTSGYVIAETTDADGVSCASDTFIRLYASNGTQELASDNDDGADDCSLIDGTGADTGAKFLAAGTYYVSVEESGNNSTIPSYLLKVTTGISYPPETEPNDSTADADARAPSIQFTGDGGYSGSIGFANKDFFKVSLASTSVVRFETFNSTGVTCTGAVPTTLRLYDGAGVETKSDTTSGITLCSAIVTEVPTGTSYVSVEDTGNDGAIAAYSVQAEVLTNVGSEAEPNETSAQATNLTGTNIVVSGDHETGSDIDYYSITVPAGASVRAETIEGNGNLVETCESNEVDSFVTLLDANNAFVASNDDFGRGECSLLDGTGTSSPLHPGAHSLPAGTYYLKVEKASKAAGTDGQFDYRLAVTIRKP